MTRNYDDWKLESPFEGEIPIEVQATTITVCGYNYGDESHTLYEGDDLSAAYNEYENQQSMLEETHPQGYWEDVSFAGDCEIKQFMLKGEIIYRLVYEETFD